MTVVIFMLIAGSLIGGATFALDRIDFKKAWQKLLSFASIFRTSAWMQNDQYASQIGHFLGGGSIVLVVALFSATLRTSHAWTAVLVTGGLVAAIAAVKEFYYDARFEKDPPQTFADNLMDFSFYVLGGGVATLIAWAAFALGGM